MSKPVALVTGASRGIGRAVAEELARREYEVYGGARSWGGENADLPFTPVKLDITDDDSVNEVLNKIKTEKGRVDLLVNNAGLSHCGPLEETPLDYGRTVFDTNYFGLLRITNAVLPVIRERGGGTVANIGSVAGKVGIPFQGHYSASKFALEGLSETMRYELAPFGIRVLLIEPGDVATDIWAGVKNDVPESSPYSKAMKRFLAAKEREMSKGATPVDQAARQIADVIESKTTKLRKPVAKMAGLLLFLRKVMPDGLFMKMVARNYGLRLK